MISSWKVTPTGGALCPPTLSPHLLQGNNNRVATTDSQPCGLLALITAAEPVMGQATSELTSCEKINLLLIHVSTVRISICNQNNLKSYCKILFHI